MVISTGGLFGQRGAPTTFLVRRIARIVPIYWLTTAIYVAASFVIASYRDAFNLPLIIASLLFILGRGQMASCSRSSGKAGRSNLKCSSPFCSQ